MTRRFIALGAVAASLQLCACAAAPAPSKVAGYARDDAQTAHLRAVFANGDTLSLAQASTLLTANDWTCAYHATTVAYGLVGHEDVSYQSHFQGTDGATVAETASQAKDSASGAALLATWTGSYAYSQAGLRTASGNGEARLLRPLDDGTIGIEWLYTAPAGDTSGDLAVGDPDLYTAGIALCTAATR